jgi:IclR family pca regulon transcriptional regulator
VKETATTRTDKTEAARARVPEGMGGLSKGLAILEAFASTDGRMTIADAAKAAGATRASARRCLLTLTELGYLEFDGKFYRPQPRLLLLSTSYSMSRPLPQIAQPILAQARNELGESISLAVLDGDTVLFVARAEAARLVSTRISLGTRMPAYSLAVGRVLIGPWSDDKLRAYLRDTKLEPLTKHSIVRKNQLFEAVRRAQEQGYATTDEELDYGMRSVAVPVVDSRGQIVGSMGASASTARISMAQMIKEFVPVMREHAAKLGRGL